MNKVRDYWRRMPRAERLWISICASGTAMAALEQVTIRGHL
jgi:hypothetical protein